MERRSLEKVVNNIDARLSRVEHILPTLATKDGLREELKQFATKAELTEALKSLATKEELKQFATKAEMVEEGERTRRHFDVVAERLEGHIKLLAEGQDVLREQMDRRFDDLRPQLTDHERRITRLEVRRS
jgi:CRISPR/Cas system CMR-associated protein Cmr5 small subunit